MPRSTSQAWCGSMVPPRVVWTLRSRAQQLRVAGDDHPADDVGVPVEELGHAVHDQVGAELERPLQQRRGEGVVDDEERAVLVRERGALGEVGERQGRVCRALDVDQQVSGRRAATQFAGSVVSTKVEVTPKRENSFSSTVREEP